MLSHVIAKMRKSLHPDTVRALCICKSFLSTHKLSASTFPVNDGDGEIAKAPAVEQDFPPAATLPRGAVLNWFCAQIALLGRTGAPDLEMTIVDGHESYLNQIKWATDRLLSARCD